MSAYQRARQLTGAGDDVVGIGCTAALTTDRSRRGTDRCFIAAQTAKRTMIDFIAFNNAHSETSRAQQERACSDAVINLLARVAGVTDGPLSLPIGNIETDHVAAPLAWQALLAGINASTLNELATPSPVKLLFPGSFNPLHQGHQDMVRIAEDISGELAVLEISTFNVDKPPIDYIEMGTRNRPSVNATRSFSPTRQLSFRKHDYSRGSCSSSGSTRSQELETPGIIRQQVQILNRIYVKVSML